MYWLRVEGGHLGIYRDPDCGLRSWPLDTVLVLGRGEPGHNSDMTSEDETSADLIDKSHDSTQNLMPWLVLIQHKDCKPLGYSSLVLRTSQRGAAVWP